MSIRSIRRGIGWLGLAVAVAGGGAADSEAGIVNLGTANAYNVFSLGDNTQYGTDAQGRVAVGGNAYFSGPNNPRGTGYTIASNLPGGGSTNLVVGGDYANSGHTVNGSVVVGGTATIAGPTINGNLAAVGSVILSGSGTVNGNVTYGAGYTNPGVTIGGTVQSGTTALPINFASEKNYLTNLSASLARAATTGTVAFTYGQFVLTGTNATSNVFNIRGSDLASANGISLNAASGSTVVINVDGATDQMQYLGINLNGFDQQRVLFNFNAATSLTLSGISVLGSILAPNAAVAFNNGNINGTLAVGSITGTGESHDFQFRGDLSSIVGPGAVPEPASLALVLVGLGLTGVVARRRLAG